MKIIIKIWVLILFFVLGSGYSSYTQNESLRFEHLGFEEGLSHNNVNTILQDSKGYIWIGTMDGLNKYDGYTFTKYKFDPLDPNSISQNFIYTLWEDKQGAIWMGTFEGLCKFDRHTEKFTRYKPDPNAEFNNPNIISINEDNNGMMWVGSATGSLCRFDPKTGKFLPEYFDLRQSQFSDGIHCIYKDRTGVLWVGCAGLHRLIVKPAKPGQRGEVEITDYLNDPTNPNSLSAKIVSAVFEDHKGILWIATDNALNSLDEERHFFTRYLHDPKNNSSISTNNLSCFLGKSIDEDKEGNLWIGSQNDGINKLNENRSAFTVFKHNPSNDNSLSADSITSVFIDRSGILWVGSWNGKLNKANLFQKPFELRRNLPGDNNSLSNNNVTAILEDSFGIIWIGTYGGGLNRWDKKTNQFTHYRHDPNNAKTLKSDAVCAILEDHDRQLWVCNGEFLSKLNEQTGEFIHYNSVEDKFENTNQPEILNITEDREGLIWLATEYSIKSFNKKTGKFLRHYYHNKADSTGISDYTAIAIFADSRNNIWVGHGSIATDRLDKRTGLITHYKHNSQDASSISSNIVNSFFEDSKGNLWLVTSAGGLCQFNYKTEKFTTYTNKQGLADNSVYSILEDDKNYLWLGTANGLSRFDPVTKKFTNYDYQEGLQGREFAAGNRHRPAHFKGKDGTLYFGGSNGFNFFHPEQIKANSSLAPVVITQFKLFDSLVKGANEKKEIILKHNQNYFSFEFSSLSFQNPAKNQYEYKLEGVDKDWVYSGTRRYVAYTNIGAGKFIFKVKATNSDGIWNEQGVSFTIIIQPPWWQTWWAYTLYVMTFFIALIIFIKWREKSLRKEKEVLEKKVGQRTQELQHEKEKVEGTLVQVKSLQAQLVETEKINERLRISQELHDDIGGTLSGIVLYSHLAENQVQAQHPNEAEQSLSLIKQSANDMVNKLSDIIWSVNPEHNSIKNLFQKLREYATEMGAAKNIKVRVDVPESLEELQLPVETRHSAYLLFKEAINNAVKYSGASLLQLSIHHFDHSVEFTISDNGKWFDVDAVKKGNGLINMQKRAEDINAKFCLKSIPQQGTVISLQCKIT